VLARFFSKPFFIAALLWLVLLTVSYFVFNLIVMPYFAGKFVGKVKVPAMVKMDSESARASLTKLSLIYMLDSTGDYSNDVGAGKILSQYPLEGTEVKKGRRVWVKISKGLKSVELPSLRGLSLRQAEITLQQLGLKLGHVREVRNSNIPSGAVIGSSPKMNAHLEQGHSVDIEISQGADAVATVMPTLTGLSLSQAKEKLKTLNLNLGQVTFKKAAHTLPGTVLSQSPSEGSKLIVTPVDLVVSK